MSLLCVNHGRVTRLNASMKAIANCLLNFTN